MKIKRAVMLAVLVAATAALVLPVIGLRARAASSSAGFRASRPLPLPQQAQVVSEQTSEHSNAPAGKYSPDTLRALGYRPLPDGVHSRQVGKLLAQRIQRANPGAELRGALPVGTGPGGAVAIEPPAQRKGGGEGPPLAGQPYR